MLHDEFQFMHEKIENQPNPFSFCEGVNMPQLSSIDRKVNTSPGIDGLGPAFYKVFWKKIGPLIVDSLNYGYKLEKLSPTQRRGIISLIPKGDNMPKDSLKSYRPISLTCTDYKIGSRCNLQRGYRKLLNLL